MKNAHPARTPAKKRMLTHEPETEGYKGIENIEVLLNEDTSILEEEEENLDEVSTVKDVAD